MQKWAVLFVTSIALAACTRTHSTQPPTQGAIGTTAGGAPGYQHGARGSLLALGDGVTRRVEHGLVKEVGDQATLAIDLKNGSAFGTPNADAASLKSRPYGATPAAHDEFARSYFLRLGIPSDQILRVRTMTLLEAQGEAGGRAKPKPSIVAYYSVVDRAVEGVPVPDSFAWARVNAEGRVVAEGVYWPPLSGQVVAGARRLRDVIADPARQAALEASIPVPIRDRGVAIRHSSAWVDTPFEAFASYDVAVMAQATPDALRAGPGADGHAVPSSPAGAMTILHFDENGAEHRLPQEQRRIASSDPRGDQKTSRP